MGHPDQKSLGEPKHSVVALHCSASDSRQWASFAGRLSSNRSVLTPDFIGTTKGNKWDGKHPFSLQDEGLAVVDKFMPDHGRVSLVGHSYGAAVALTTALRWSDWVTDLVLYEPTSFHLVHGDASANAIISSEGLRLSEEASNAVLAGDYEAGLRTFVNFWAGSEVWQVYPESRRAALRTYAPKLTMEFHALLNDPHRLKDLERLEVPVSILYGRASPDVTRNLARRIAEHLPFARIRELPEFNHLAPLTHAEQVAELIGKELAANQSMTTNF